MQMQMLSRRNACKDKDIQRTLLISLIVSLS